MFQSPATSVFQQIRSRRLGTGPNELLSCREIKTKLDRILGRYINLSINQLCCADFC